MNIPPLRWGDALSRTGDDIVIPLSPSQQYILQILTSWAQLNPSLVFSDYQDYDVKDIHQGIDELLNRVISDDMASLWKQGRLPKLTGDLAVVTTGNAIAFTGGTAFYGGGVWAQTAAAINDKFSWSKIAMKAGAWRINVRYTKNNASGIASFRINDVTTILTVDAYAAAGVNNNLATGTFTITTDDIYQLYVRVASKNASSSGYSMLINSVELVRESD